MGVKDVLLLRSERFAFAARGLAGYLAGAIDRRREGHVVDCSVDEIDPVVVVPRGERRFLLTIETDSVEMDDGENDDVCFVRFSEAHGCIAIFWRPADDAVALRGLRALVHEIVLSDTRTFRSAQWLTQAEYDELG